MFVDKSATDLLAGYEKVCRAEAALAARLREPLLESYVRQRERYGQARAEYKRKRAILKRLALYGPAAVVASFLAGILADRIGLAVGGALDANLLYPLGQDLLWLGAGLIVPTILVVIWRAFLSEPDLPQNPMRPCIRNKLAVPLLSQWWDGLQAPLPTEVVKHGDAGENDVVHALQGILDDSYFILHKLQQQPGDDIDVVVVGPRGIWAFEVKYWSGTIRWREGQWQRTREYYEPGGILVEDQKAVHQDPDKQWRRMADDIVKTLQRNARKLVFSSPDLVKIQGGIVFAHLDGIYDIPRYAPFKWGRLQDLERWLQTVPVDPTLDRPKLVGVLDALLARHREVAQTNGAKLFSMAAHADQVIRAAETNLKQYAA